MKAFTVAITALAGLVAALPAQVEERQVPYTACSGLYGTSQCCATDVLGVADLDCANRMSFFYSQPPSMCAARKRTD